MRTKEYRYFSISVCFDVDPSHDRQSRFRGKSEEAGCSTCEIVRLVADIKLCGSGVGGCGVHFIFCQKCVKCMCRLVSGVDQRDTGQNARNDGCKQRIVRTAEDQGVGTRGADRGKVPLCGQIGDRIVGIDKSVFDQRNKQGAGTAGDGKTLVKRMKRARICIGCNGRRCCDDTDLSVFGGVRCCCDGRIDDTDDRSLASLKISSRSSMITSTQP